MASTKKTSKRARKTSGGGDRKLYTLTEVGKKAGVSMPTMQRYKKEYQARIPSQGKGRGQRYPEEAIAVIREIKEENLKRRGGARRSKAKTRAKAGTKARAKASTRTTATGSEDTYLPLTEIARRAGISYPTARKYAAQHAGAIPSRGRGRSRRYGVETIEVFKNLRSQSRRGRKPAAGGRKRKTTATRRVSTARSASVQDRALANRIQQLEKAQKDISRQLQDVINTLRQPIQVTIEGR